MPSQSYQERFGTDTCTTLLPQSTADDFFEALFGDASEGAYDIALSYSGSDNGTIMFDILLRERPGHCLSCSLTYGLPQVFSRHPVINIAGIVEKIDAILADSATVKAWRLGATRQLNSTEHAIPLIIDLQEG